MNSLPLKDLHKRHRALTQSIASSYLEAASVCLDRHHKAPIDFILMDQTAQSSILVEWDEIDNRTREAWANRDDATRDGAYALAIAALELSREMYAIRRAETLTGADYYVASATQNLSDLENWFRLEISGTNLSETEVRKRLKQKQRQVQKGLSNLPAIVSIVGFRVRLIVIQTVDDDL